MIKILNISYNIKKIRESREMIQTELAIKVNSTQSMIAQIETGKRNLNISMLIKICHALNCTPNDILGFTSETPEQEQEQGDEGGENHEEQRKET